MLTPLGEREATIAEAKWRIQLQHWPNARTVAIWLYTGMGGRGQGTGDVSELQRRYTAHCCTLYSIQSTDVRNARSMVILGLLHAPPLRDA